MRRMGFKPMIEFSCISIQQTNLSAGRIVATFQGMPAEIPSLQVGPLGHSFFAALMFFAGWFHYHKVENKEEIKGSYGECGQKSIKIVNSLALFTYSYRRRHLRRFEPQKRNPPPPTFAYCLPMCLDNNFKACRAFFGGFISSENGGAVVLR